MKDRYYAYDTLVLPYMVEGEIEMVLNWWGDVRSEFSDYPGEKRENILEIPGRPKPIYYAFRQYPKAIMLEQANGEIDLRLDEGYALLGPTGSRRIYLFTRSEPSVKPELALDSSVGLPLFKEALRLFLKQPLEEVMEEVNLNPSFKLKDAEDILSSWKPSSMPSHIPYLRGNPSTGWNEDEMVELVREIIRDAKKAKLGDDEQGF